MDLQLVDFDHPSETREFANGRFEVYRVGPMTLGRATYDPGWKWSEHVGASLGERLARPSTSASCSRDRQSSRWPTGAKS
jgi:hypothetical protein